MNRKKIIAREFLFFIATCTLTIITLLSMYAYNKISDFKISDNKSNIDEKVKELAITKNKLDNILIINGIFYYDLSNVNKDLLKLAYIKLKTNASFEQFIYDFLVDEQLQRLTYSKLETNATFEEFLENASGTKSNLNNLKKKLSIKEFSNRIKERFPVYKNIDDIELVNKILKKYPFYKEKLSFSKNTVNQNINKKENLLLKESLDRVVHKMIQNNENDDEIEFVIIDFKKKYGIQENSTTINEWLKILKINKEIEESENKIIQVKKNKIQMTPYTNLISLSIKTFSIFFLILFVLRHAINGVKWSIKTLKQ